MGNVTPLITGFRRFLSDVARDQLPKDAAYRLTDWVPFGSGFRGRSAWQNVVAGNVSLSGIAWAPFQDYPVLMSVGQTGTVYMGGGSIGGSHGQPLTHRPFFHKDRMIICGNLAGTAVNPYKVTLTGTPAYTAAVVGGTPPQARMGCSWGDYLLLGNYYDPGAGGALKNNRVAWSAVGDPDTWTYAGANASTLDLPKAVIGAMRLRNLTIFWGYDSTWIYTGDTPPPGSNLSLARTLAFGTVDSRSIAQYNDQAIFANESGVWMTDGSSEVNLTLRGGISDYYRTLLQNFSIAGNYTVAGDVLYGFYVLTITSGGTEVATLVCSLDDYSWFSWSNFPATMYGSRPAGPGDLFSDPGNEELYFVGGTAAGAVSPIFNIPNNGPTYHDGNSVNVTPSLETPSYSLGDLGYKRIRRVYVDYFLSEVNPGDATLTLSYQTDVFSGSAYTACTPTLPANVTSALQRVPVEIRKKARNIAFKLEQTGPSIYTQLVGLEIEGHAMEPSR